MTNIAADLEELQRKVQAAQAKKTRAEIELENAQKLRTETLEALETEYGVKSLDEAEALKSKLTKALEEAIDKAKKALAESDE